MVVLKSEEKIVENVRGSDHFSNDESARPPTPLKTEYITDILVGQIDKFQNGCFKEHLWKVAAASTKTMYFKSIPWNMLTQTLNVSIFVSSFLNFV